ncbi:MAG: hypothetical protein WCK74_09915 [Gemmatimonadaceae bacterium]
MKHGFKSDRSAGADPALSALLRSAYAPPAEDAYWERLEQRVLARLSDTPVTAWWNVLSEWRLIGAAAALLAVALTGATIVRELSNAQTSSEMAAGAVIESGFSVDEATLTARGRRLPPDAPERYLEPFGY